jgi:dihydroneopterin aldolase
LVSTDFNNVQAPAAAPTWDPNCSHIRVFLRGLRTEAHLGLHAWERHPERPTRLIVNVELLAPTDGPLHEKAPFIDYDIVRNAVRAWPQRPHTGLLETLAEDLVAQCFLIEAVQACRVSIEKPDIFNDADAAGVEVFRVRPAK